MLKHNNLRSWEKLLKDIFSRLDIILEEKYGDLFPLQPNRPIQGTTANNAYDGLFNVGASFSLGLGSEHGAGYVIEIRLATLEKVPDNVKERIDNDVLQFLNKALPETFPEKNLQVKKDGKIYKIHGDLSLGNLK